jgi:hypothetical protein
MTLPAVPLDSANERQHRTMIATVLNELAKQFPQHGSWTAVIAGSTGAGTYEITTNSCRYTRIGRRVWVDVFIVMAAAVTGGGTGTLNITGLPFIKSTGTYPIGGVQLAGIDWTAGTNLTIGFSTSLASSTLLIQETADNASYTQVPISAIAANDQIFASICYETDDP